MEMPDTQKLNVPVLHGIADFRRTGVIAVYYELVVCYMVDIAFCVC